MLLGAESGFLAHDMKLCSEHYSRQCLESVSTCLVFVISLDVDSLIKKSTIISNTEIWLG